MAENPSLPRLTGQNAVAASMCSRIFANLPPQAMLLDDDRKRTISGECGSFGCPGMEALFLEEGIVHLSTPRRIPGTSSDVRCLPSQQDMDNAEFMQDYINRAFSTLQQYQYDKSMKPAALYHTLESIVEVINNQTHSEGAVVLDIALTDLFYDDDAEGEYGEMRRQLIQSLADAGMIDGDSDQKWISLAAGKHGLSEGTDQVGVVLLRLRLQLLTKYHIFS